VRPMTDPGMDDFAEVSIQEAGTQLKYTVDLPSRSCTIADLAEEIAAWHPPMSPSSVRPSLNGHPLASSLTLEEAGVLPASAVDPAPTVRVRFVRVAAAAKAKRATRPASSQASTAIPTCWTDSMGEGSQASAASSDRTRPRTTPAWMTRPSKGWEEHEAGGNLARWPYPAGIFPRAATAFPADFRPQQPAAPSWEPHRMDGFTGIGHMASKNFPRRDVAPKPRILPKEMLHRRFSTLMNLFKDGGELKDKREARPSFDWESRWDGSTGKGLDASVPEYDALADPHCRSMAKKIMKISGSVEDNDVFLATLNLRVMNNTRRKNENTNAWIARLTKDGEKFSVARVGNAVVT